MGKELSVCECVKGRNLALSELGVMVRKKELISKGTKKIYFKPMDSLLKSDLKGVI